MNFIIYHALIANLHIRASLLLPSNSITLPVFSSVDCMGSNSPFNVLCLPNLALAVDSAHPNNFARLCDVNSSPSII